MDTVYTILFLSASELDPTLGTCVVASNVTYRAVDHREIPSMRASVRISACTRYRCTVSADPVASG